MAADWPVDYNGKGHLETESGESIPVRYFVRMYRERPVYPLDSVGRLAADDEDVFSRLLGRNVQNATLILEDGSRLPVRLTSAAGRIEIHGAVELALR